MFIVNPFWISSLLLHLLIALLLIFDFPFFSSEKPQEKVISFAMIPASEITNIPYAKPPSKNNVKNDDARKIEKTKIVENEKPANEEKNIKQENIKQEEIIKEKIIEKKLNEEQDKTENKEQDKPENNPVEKNNIEVNKDIKEAIVPEKKQKKNELKEQEKNIIKKDLKEDNKKTKENISNKVAEETKKEAKNQKSKEKDKDKPVKQPEQKKKEPQKTEQKPKIEKKPQNTEKKPQNTEKKNKQIDEIDALLKNLEQNSEGNNQKSNKYNSIKSKDVKAISDSPFDEDKELSISETALIKQQLERNWNIPLGTENIEKAKIRVYIALNKDGTIKQVEVKNKICPNISEATCRILVDNAKRAVFKSSPIEGLNPDRYDEWKEFYFIFDSKNIHQ